MKFKWIVMCAVLLLTAFANESSSPEEPEEVLYIP